MSRLTLKEAISHAKEVAEENYRRGMLCHANPNDEELDKCIECGREHEQLAGWLEELQKYKELEEQGRLIELPCNGERKNEKFLYITTIKQFEITKNAVYMIDTDTVWSSTENSFNIDEIGRTVFLTKEEAESKLKELRGEQK